MSYNCNIKDILWKKSKKYPLTSEEIQQFVADCVQGRIQECQIGAMLMAIYINGLTDDETFYLTRSIINSGKIMTWKSEWNDLIVDKHSTGGVGDKVSIILVPALAACGMKVPMISGRGLGLTGGTLDKLQSIPGFTVDYSEEKLMECLESAGCFISGANEYLCPGDRILYHIRDITMTVDNTNLIQSSIVSKKAAAGIKILLMDVKVGKGSNFKNLDEAIMFSKKLKSLCLRLGISARIILSRMDSPLGQCVGNALEIQEVVEILKGVHGAISKSVYDIVVELGSNLLEMAGKASSCSEGKKVIENVLSTGQALECFQKMIRCQGVSDDLIFDLCFTDNNEVLSRSLYRTLFKANVEGWITEISASVISKICLSLGAGRYKCSDNIDYGVGIKLLCTVGDWVSVSTYWLELHHNQEMLDENLKNDIYKALAVSTEQFKSEVIIDIL